MKKILFVLLSLCLFAPSIADAQTVVVSTQEARVSAYKTLAQAVTAIGTAKRKLVIDRDVTITQAQNIPVNVVLSHVNNAKIINAGAGKIVCAANCLDNPMSDTVQFSNFAVGDLSFTGTKYPSRISTALFDNANASTRINIADKALLGKPAEIFATPGLLAEEVLITEYHSLRLGVGTFENSVSGGYKTAFTLQSNTKIFGAGIGLTRVKETSSGNTTDIGIIYSSGARMQGSVGATENITISDLTLLGNPAQDTNQVQSAIMLGNVTNARVERIHVKGVHGFAVYFGGTWDDGLNNTARNCFLLDSIFENVGTQNVGSINSDGLTISRNRFVGGGQVTSNYSYYIDLEPSGAGLMQNITVSENSLEGTLTANPNYRALHGIRVNAASIGNRVKNVAITNNSIKGIDLGADLNTAEGFFTGISLNGVENAFIHANQITGTKQPAFLFEDVAGSVISNNVLTMTGRYYGTPAMILRGVTDTTFSNNEFKVGRIIAPAGLDGINLSFSKVVSEQAQTMGASVATTGGVSTVTVTQGDRIIYDWYAGKKINLSGLGDFTVAAVDRIAKTLTLTTNAGNATGVTLATKFGNNKYVNNIDAIYDFQPGSASVIVDALNPSKVNAVIYTNFPAQSQSGYTIFVQGNTPTLPDNPAEGTHFIFLAGNDGGFFKMPSPQDLFDTGNRYTFSNTSKYKLTAGCAVRVEYAAGIWWVTSKNGATTFIP